MGQRWSAREGEFPARFGVEMGKTQGGEKQGVSSPPLSFVLFRGTSGGGYGGRAEGQCIGGLMVEFALPSFPVRVLWPLKPRWAVRVTPGRPPGDCGLSRKGAHAAPSHSPPAAWGFTVVVSGAWWPPWTMAWTVCPEVGVLVPVGFPLGMDTPVAWGDSVFSSSPVLSLCSRVRSRPMRWSRSQRRQAPASTLHVLRTEPTSGFVTLRSRPQSPGADAWD